MREQLPHASYSFLSTLNSNATPIGISASGSPLAIIENIQRPEQVIAFLEKESPKNIFILSGSKSHGQDLFQQLVRYKKDEQRLIVGENIT